MAKRRWRRITPQKRREIIAAAARGASYETIARLLDSSTRSVGRVLVPLGGVIRAEHWSPSAARLCLDDRVEIRMGLERGESYRRIAAGLGRHCSSVSRE